MRNRDPDNPMGTYVLNANGKPVPEPDMMKWAIWYEDAKERIIAKTELDGVLISTIFLGLDHNFSENGPPVLWETMVFGGPLNRDASRCAGSREQAEAMHQEFVERVEALLALKL